MSQAPTQPSQQQASQPEPFKFQSAPDQQRPSPKHYQKHDPKREQVNAALRRDLNFDSRGTTILPVHVLTTPLLLQTSLHDRCCSFICWDLRSTATGLLTARAILPAYYLLASFWSGYLWMCASSTANNPMDQSGLLLCLWFWVL